MKTCAWNRTSDGMSPSIRYGFWALMALTALLYAGSVGIPFRIDDRMCLGLKPGIGSWDNWTALFREPYYILPEAGIAQYYRPLPALLQKAQYALFDDTPVGYHLVNVGLHLINGWLVFRVARLVVRRASGAYFAAACFLLHPLQTEVVNYISHFTCLLSSTAMLSALLCYLLFRVKGETRWYFLSLLLSGAGMLSKESALVIPLIFCWCEAVLPPDQARRSARQRVSGLAGYFLLLAVYLVLRRSLLGPGPGGLGSGEIGWLSLLTAGKGILVYGRLILFPGQLHFFRALAMEANPWRLPLLLPLVSALAAVVWIMSRRNRLPPALSLGFGWLAIGLLPVSGIKPLYMQPGVIYWAEHFLYFPLAGAALLAAGLGDGLAEGPTRRIVLLGAAVAACWTALTLSQNLLWRDDVRFARKSVQYEPRI
ncbi:MAG: glycosyltransferase family 39 protein, partial [Candidatus Aureabacteria bacterium]|nr:glycosyltransferase family 39 protein [Candidatus Auribacterota bacterium]